MTIQFQAGHTYFTRSITDHNTIVEVEVVSRTAKTIKAQTAKGVKTLRVGEYDGKETVKPWGSYSMCPVVDASKECSPCPDVSVLIPTVAAALGVSL